MTHTAGTGEGEAVHRSRCQKIKEGKQDRLGKASCWAGDSKLRRVFGARQAKSAMCSAGCLARPSVVDKSVGQVILSIGGYG
jgi:hypothetical protein